MNSSSDVDSNFPCFKFEQKILLGRYPSKSGYEHDGFLILLNEPWAIDTSLLRITSVSGGVATYIFAALHDHAAELFVYHAHLNIIYT